MSFWTTMAEMMARPKDLEWPILSSRTCITAMVPDQPLFTAGGVPMKPPIRSNALIIPREATPESPFNEPYECAAEILFEFEDWRIECYDDIQPVFDECDWVSHYCPVYGWRYRIDQWQIMADGVCPVCCEEVPEEVMTVWQLKNFDKLPTRDFSREINSAKVYKGSNEDEVPIW